MKIKTIAQLAVALLLSALNHEISRAFAQGSLTPPGAPAPTMKSLDQIEARAPINTLPGDSSDLHIISQPGSYYLTANLVITGATNAIRVSASDVVIDLNGFTLYGNSNQTAIRSTLPNLSGILIRNGQIVGWASGIQFYIFGAVTNVAVENVRMNLANGVSFAAGIECGDEARISRCSISGVNGSSSSALTAGAHCAIDACSIVNCFAGVSLGSFSTVKDCMIKNCSGADGLSVINNCVIRNNLVEACQSGMTFYDSCVVSQNTCQDSTGNGFNISGNFSRVEDNLANGNSFYGFISQGSTTNNFIVRNTARGNHSANFSLNNTDAAGPIVSSPGPITTNSPWANFSF